MFFESKVFWLEKDAREREQYQDAYAQDAERGLAAIADGVTSGIFSGAWARLLTAAVVADPPTLESPAFADWLGEQRAAWRAAIDTSRLTWYQRPKMADGGMTTLLWIEFLPDGLTDSGLPKYRGRSFAIGDSCLFHLRDGALLACFPLTTAADFASNPAVLRSVDRQVDPLLEFQSRELICQPGDLFVLCTDAVALWAMRQYEAGGDVDWARYWDLSEADWREEICGLREAGAMRYDDSTVLLLRVAERPAETAPAELPANGIESAQPAFDDPHPHDIPDDEADSRAEDLIGSPPPLD